eukprot:356387-Chlamydomonas_euryale.AAC.8
MNSPSEFLYSIANSEQLCHSPSAVTTRQRGNGGHSMVNGAPRSLFWVPYTALELVVAVDCGALLSGAMLSVLNSSIDKFLVPPQVRTCRLEAVACGASAPPGRMHDQREQAGRRHDQREQAGRMHD